jgi:transcriptional regulator with XRE-family HTH domain
VNYRQEIPVKPSTLSPEQCRWARRALSLSQRQLNEESGASLAYIKQFETGRFRPGEEFQRSLLEFFEGRGIDFSEFEGGESQPGVGTKAGQPQSAPVRRPCFYASPDLSEPALDALLEAIDASTERLEKMLAANIKRGLFGGVSDESAEVTQEIFGELALLGTRYSALVGRFSIEPRLVAEPKIQQEQVATWLAKVNGDKGEDAEAA